MIMIASGATRLLLPITTLGVAEYAHTQQLGLFNYAAAHWFTLSSITWILISILLLDLMIYLQHLASHHIPLLWRIHQVHHLDQDLDVTTGLRFHPVEIILSTLYKCLLILLLGIPVVAVLIFEILLNVTAMFSHGNIALPKWMDRYLRWFIVVPDMHRVHHSVIKQEMQTNYGFNLSWWDRLFGTYQDQPTSGHEQMALGMSDYQQAEQTSLLTCLVWPFKQPKQGL